MKIDKYGLPELKPCKCGPGDVLESTSRDTTFECMRCGFKITKPTVLETIKAWNSRPEN